MKIPSVSRQIVDAWPVAEAGLPARAVHCSARADVHTVGDLRRWKTADLLAMRTFGVRSLTQTRLFLRQCRHLQSGGLEFDNLKSVLQTFLLPAQLTVLTRRYGLNRTDVSASRNFETLQKIARDRRVTRERARQTEVAAFVRLQHRLPTTCLAPFLDAGAEFLASRGGAADVSEVAAWAGAGLYAPYNPAAAFLLLADILPGRISFLSGLFLAIDPVTLDLVERHARACLDAARGPVDPGAVIRHIRSALPGESPAVDPVSMTRILGHMPDVLAARDGNFILMHHADRLATGLLGERAGESLHFEDIANLVNSGLQERHALSPAQVLMRICRSPVFERAGRGRYRVVPGASPAPSSA